MSIRARVIRKNNPCLLVNFLFSFLFGFTIQLIIYRANSYSADCENVLLKQLYEFVYLLRIYLQ